MYKTLIEINDCNVTHLQTSDILENCGKLSRSAAGRGLDTDHHQESFGNNRILSSFEFVI